MTRVQIFSALTVVWIVLAILQFVTGAVWLGVLFVVVAVLQVANVVHERRRVR